LWQQVGVKELYSVGCSIVEATNKYRVIGNADIVVLLEIETDCFVIGKTRQKASIRPSFVTTARSTVIGCSKWII
jgi:hypothetical protein